MNARLPQLALLCAVTLFCLLGCPKRSLTLPGNWPIPQLSLPPGAVLISTEVDIPPQSADPRISSATFRPSSSWDLAVRHVEQCLAPLKYVECVDVHPGGQTMQDRMRIYCSSDDKTLVELMVSQHRGTMEVSLVVKQYGEPQGVIGLDGHVYGSGVRIEIRPLQ